MGHEKALAGASEKLEVVHGSENVFRDLGHESADAEQFKAILAAEIIKALDREHLTVRAAHPALALPPRTSRASAMLTSDASLLIALCRSSTVLVRGSRLRSVCIVPGQSHMKPARERGKQRKLLMFMLVLVLAQARFRFTGAS